MLNVAVVHRSLSTLSVRQLQEAFGREAGEPARSNNRAFLIKRLLWLRLAAAQGGLSERARSRATELARDRDIRVRPPQAIHDAVKAAVAPGGLCGRNAICGVRGNR